MDAIRFSKRTVLFVGAGVALVLLDIVFFFPRSTSSVVPVETAATSTIPSTQIAAQNPEPVELYKPFSESFVEGKGYTGIGVFHGSPSVGGLKSFSSDELGISFKYPDDFLLFGNVNSDGIHTFGIGFEQSIRDGIGQAEAGVGSESAPMLIVVFIPKPDPSKSVLDWMRSRAPYSNFEPQYDTMTAESFASTTVAGIPGYSWH